MLNIFISPGIGNGWYLYEQGNWYEGEWLEDKRHGRGFRRYKNGAKYNGNWCDNKKEGEGSMYWENNDVSNTFFFGEYALVLFQFYAGEWKDDNPNGYGEYTWNVILSKQFVFPCCSWYKGSWVEGVRNGAGEGVAKKCTKLHKGLQV